MRPAPASRRTLALVSLVAVAGTLPAQPARSETSGAAAPSRLAPGVLDLGGDPVAGGEEHWYRRNRSLLGAAAPDPWHARLARPLSATPSWRLLRTDAQLLLNTTMPWGKNDGPLWAGRGTTVALQGGIAARWGPVRLQVAPVAFWAQNSRFDLLPNGRTGPLAFGDARFPEAIDLPQRFGDAPYARVDLGDTEVSITRGGFIGGISSARQIWGPARDYPLVLSTNAGGFPHIFTGTARPLVTPIGTMAVRLIAGRIEQSAWSPVQSGVRGRFTSALTARLSPRGASWLTLGGNREVQGPWSAAGLTLDRVLRPFQGVLSDNTGAINANSENGFVSVFLHATFAPDGLELYAEMSREDFANDVRWLLQKPDDLSAIVLGFAKGWTPDGTRLRTIRAELVNGELAPHERLQRGFTTPIPPYTHAKTRQGLTSRGQLLGSPAAYGGGGWTLEWRDHTPRGRTTLAIERLLQLDWQPTAGNASRPQVTYAVRAERLRFHDGSDLTLGLTPTLTLNTNLTPFRDVLGLSALVRWRGW